MLVSTIVRTVRFCIRHPKAVVALYLVLAVAAGVYAARNFAIDTDVNKLISPALDWRQREIAFEKSFPGRFDTILVVVDAPTPELAARATSTLAARLKQNTVAFRGVEEPGGGPFFSRNGLLFQSVEELEATAKGLSQAGPLVRTLGGDPNLRGLVQGLSLVLSGVRGNMVQLDAAAPAFDRAAETIEDALAGRPASFSWQALMTGKEPAPEDLRRFVEVRPVLDYTALEPGAAASAAIREAARELDLAGQYQARVRLTGPIAMADEEFSTMQTGAVRDMVLTIVVVLGILWLALRSAKLIFAVYANMFVGLSMTAAIGLLLVDALNPISVAFAVLFIGLGVDFGIQFAVRYRTERHEIDDLKTALVATARRIGAPLTLAASAVAAAFLSFTPTDYSGISELGKIAGIGMLIALITSVTLLPALLKVLNPPGEPDEIGYRQLAPVDRFLERHRIAVVGGTALVALLGAPLLYFLTFDFNPINLRNKNVESVATLLDLRADPNIGANAIDVLAPNAAEAAAAAEKLRSLPEVARVMTLTSFVPSDQEQKLAIVEGLKKVLGPALSPRMMPTPSDADNVAALRRGQDLLTQIQVDRPGPGAEASARLAAALGRLAEAGQATRQAVEAAFIVPLKTVFDQWRDLLEAQPISLETLPADLVRDWKTPDGRIRVEATPKGDPNDTEVLRSFAEAMLTAFPTATGAPISILKSGETVVSAFIHAGIYALVSIMLLLWIVLRRFGDVLLTLVPLLLAGVLTLEFCVIIGMPMNFANIIALPLLLGVGVAFKIYYIMAWRAGQTGLLQSSLTRAVIWSALTTATAFGSLWMSSHPGTSSMGELLALSLVTTMCFAVLFQPALMGPPRVIEKEEPSAPEPDETPARKDHPVSAAE
ncbi:MMPL family transporter [Rhodoplanes sp. TEM]|uniref:MMPL family transporter n=1 Tax=Rhodoplanes tepidamans TaxID=200616 RepID=A0ABT5J995_RHOTP|nr:MULTISPECIES: MMPL family transporter [Rhodoplanes]MDC7785976.1 MMPL family transporter [Rhodoplanes tepidamans]MDC7987025.1 MMPL family transporter [Rhodoplanes sp. TEM]MDQ0357057.1 hopanoid biosynthesis associated RND transporter like protein HpnN [Rhodoplanes tepidamans]